MSPSFVAMSSEGLGPDAFSAELLVYCAELEISLDGTIELILYLSALSFNTSLNIFPVRVDEVR